MPGDPAVVLVTAAAHGLGREAAAQLAHRGHRVLITSRDADTAKSAAGELGENVSALPALDVTDPASIRDVAGAIAVDPGRLDVLINNAAAYVDWTETVTGADLDAAHRVLETNLFGAWRLIQALLPLLRQSPAPRIVNVSSGAGSHGDPGFGFTARGGAAASYGINKAALNALTATLATELAGTNILSTPCAPGSPPPTPGPRPWARGPSSRAPPVSCGPRPCPLTDPTGACSATADPCPGDRDL